MPTEKLIYGFDPLCGWCFGAIPALRHLRNSKPDVVIDVMPGGLVTGDRIVPYAHMYDYISQAAPRMAAVTGQHPSDAFFDLVKNGNAVTPASAPPSHAVLQMKALASERVPEFAHLVQEAHFVAGRDLNDPEVYKTIVAEHAFPALDYGAIAEATETTPLVSDAFAQARRLGINAFPTFIKVDTDGQLTQLPSAYNPQALLAYFS